MDTMWRSLDGLPCDPPARFFVIADPGEEALPDTCLREVASKAAQEAWMSTHQDQYWIAEDIIHDRSDSHRFCVGTLFAGYSSDDGIVVYATVITAVHEENQLITDFVSADHLEEAKRNHSQIVHQVVTLLAEMYGEEPVRLTCK